MNCRLCRRLLSRVNSGAIAGLNGASLDGRTIVVNEARQKREYSDTGMRKPAAVWDMNILARLR